MYIHNNIAHSSGVEANVSPRCSHLSRYFSSADTDSEYNSKRNTDDL